MKVYLGVGHGIRPDGRFDPGAVGGGWTEQTAGDIIVAEAARVLFDAGLDVRHEAFKSDLNFYGTVRDANRWGADVVVEVHHDWSGAPVGSFGHWVSSAGKQVADAIQAAVGRAGFLLRPSWHKKRDDLYILKHTHAPCVLYEVGRIGQSDLNEERELKVMGRAIARGILDWAGVSAPPPEKEDEEVLKQGDEGAQVAYLQRRINDAFEVMNRSGRIAEDGDFGPKTAEAVKRVQNNVGFPPTGVVDMMTMVYTQALAHAKAPHGSSGLSSAEADQRYVRRGSSVRLP